MDLVEDPRALAVAQVSHVLEHALLQEVALPLLQVQDLLVVAPVVVVQDVECLPLHQGLVDALAVVRKDLALQLVLKP